MDLKTMIYQRLAGSSELAQVLAGFDGRPAVFYQQPPTPEDEKWGDVQYPRIDYVVDMQENPARNASGVLSVNVWCDVEKGAAPEEVERILRDLLHSVFAQTDTETYCFAWVRSDAFEVKTQNEETARTIGVTVIFDLIACPCQYTMYPDPIKALNEWTKSVLPSAIVIGLDELEGWVVPTKEQPIIYWRLTSQGVQGKHFAYTWLNISVEGHVYARSADDRLSNLVRLNTAHALASHIPMEDTSPFFLRSFVCKQHLNYIAQGQIQASGHFGLLQEWYGKPPDPPLDSVNTQTQFS